MGHLHDWWEALRARTLPWLHRWLALVGAYAEGEVAPSSYALTAGLAPEALEVRLHELGFVRNPLAAFERRPGGHEVGSWARRESLLADRQLHVLLFRGPTPDETDVYAHEEASWITQPVAHYRQEAIDVVAGVRAVRALFAEAGLPVRTRADAPQDAPVDDGGGD